MASLTCRALEPLCVGAYDDYSIIAQSDLVAEALAPYAELNGILRVQQKRLESGAGLDPEFLT